MASRESRESRVQGWAAARIFGYRAEVGWKLLVSRSEGAD